MEKLKHTPGPRCSKCQWVHEADSALKTSFLGVGLCPLHASAPELLASLKETIEVARFVSQIIVKAGLTSQLDSQYNGFGKRALAVIAKAEGGN